jgi:hypothetical protein
MGVLALGDTVSQSGRPGQWHNVPTLLNFSMLRMRSLVMSSETPDHQFSACLDHADVAPGWLGVPEINRLAVSGKEQAGRYG